MKKDPNVSWQRLDPPSLERWKVAVVGGTGGLGRAISGALAARGASVTVVGRTFRDGDRPGITFVEADLSSLQQARTVARALPVEEMDLLLFTTGIFAAPTRQETAEGIERDMAVSFLSRLVILGEVASRLGQARVDPALKPRIFIMGFPGTDKGGVLGDLNAERSYSAMTVHMNTVAGNEMLVLDAAQRFPHCTVFGLNPGLVKTNIRDNFLGQGSLRSRIAEFLVGLVTPTPDAYAATVLPLLVSPDLETHSGALFDRHGQAILPSSQLTDPAHMAAFLAQSEALVGRAFPFGDGDGPPEASQGTPS